MQVKDQKQLLNMIAKVLLSYQIVDSVLVLKDKERKSLNNNFNIAISGFAKNQFNKEKELMNEILKTAAEDKYYNNGYVMQLGIDFNLQKISDEAIEKIVNEAVDGEVWSDRLWKNKKQLKNNLKKSIDSFLKGKTNVNQIEKAVKKDFNQNAFNTHRLVQTEVAKCQSLSNDVFAKEHGVDYQLYTATLDGKTSNFCREHDGIEYRIDNPDKPIPGENTHPFCRSCLINIPYGGWRPKERRDQENNEIIDWKSYNDWKDGIINNELAITKDDKNVIIKTEDDVRKFVKSDKQRKSVDKGQQDKHRKGTNAYDQRQEALKKKNEYGPSFITIDNEKIEELINKYAGTGNIKFDKNGIWDYKEVILDNNEIIGKVFNNKTGKSVDTTVFKIHYGKDGAHIVPDYPSKKKGR